MVRGIPLFAIFAKGGIPHPPPHAFNSALAIVSFPGATHELLWRSE